MCAHLAKTAVASLAVIGLGCALIPMAGAAAAQSPVWKAGACFAKAEIQSDLVDLGSAVPCEQPHTVQTVGGAALPASFDKYSIAQLTDQKDTQLRAALTRFNDSICSGRQTAAGIWPEQGPAIAKVLTGLPATASGGVLPALITGLTPGWVFPDPTSFNAGDRSMVCVIYSPDPKKGLGVAKANALKGDARQLGTSQTLPSMRDCSIKEAKSERVVIVPCSKAHGDEVVVHYLARLPADIDAMTDAQWVPYDAQCKAIAGILIGAKRNDVKIIANPAAGTKAGADVYVPCVVSRSPGADGKTPNLPAGTVVGLGTRALPAA